MSTTGRASIYRKWKEANDASNLGWVVSALFVGFLGYLIVEQDATAEILGISSPSRWTTLLIVFGVSLAGGVGMSIASSAGEKYAGIVYLKDRKAFARAGGFDVGRAPMLATQLGLFGVYWLTSQMDPDPLGFARNPWIFLAVSTLVGAVATRVLAVRLFSRQGGHGGQGRPTRAAWLPQGLQITALSADRLELAHRTALFRILGAAFCYGVSLIIYLGGPDWKEWFAIAVFLVLGTGTLLLASSRYAVFDKAADYLETRERHAWGKTTVERLPLHDISAIVESRETMGDSQLTNIFAKVGESRYPVILGSRLAIRTHEDALVMGHFLDVPVYEDEKLIARSPEPTLGDIVELAEEVRSEARKGHAG